VDSAVRKRRWYQFSLRTLLIVVTAASIPFGLVARELHIRRRQEEVRARFLEQELVVGVNRRGEVVIAGAHRWRANCFLSDEHLVHLEQCKHLKYLDISSSFVTDEGLAHIAGLKALEGLFLDYTDVTDRGLQHLEGLTNLRRLFLDHTQVTDAGLKRLGGMHKLRWLQLEGTLVTDRGLEHLKRLQSLEFLSLEGTKVTEEGAKSLRKVLPNCEIGQGPLPLEERL
jgi:hypothetical protein